MKSFGVLLVTLTEQCDILVWEYGNTISSMLIAGSFFSKYHFITLSYRELRMQRFYLLIYDVLHVTHLYFPFLY